MEGISVPISPGELLDKITILRIKSARIEDPAKLANVRRELTLLEQVWRQTVAEAAELAGEEAALERINALLWDIEDRIRECEARQRFDPAFIELARSIYLNNDERAAIKQRINRKLNSAIIEEKAYSPYR
ncbi:MAG TPA: DUF6165 family protein [Steroidobacteraceae bacterium]|jgi:hypothetical protein